MSRILIVEDEKSMRDLLALMMRKEGYAVETAESAVLAKERIQRDEPYDLVISDISMPEMSGLELLDRALDLAPETHAVFVTRQEERRQAVRERLPNTLFLSEPDTLVSLLNALGGGDRP